MWRHGARQHQRPTSKAAVRRPFSAWRQGRGFFYRPREPSLCGLCQLARRRKPSMRQLAQPRKAVAASSGTSSLVDVSTIPVPMPLELRGSRDRASVVALQCMRRQVRAGSSLWEALREINDDVEAWHARMALQAAWSSAQVGGVVGVADWDGAHGRTQSERLGAIDRALYLLGVRARRHGGGWAVSSGVAR